MKILAFNGSPRMSKGNTEKILTPFLEGAREAGAEVEVVYLRKIKLQPCVGCFSCWFKTPGVCAINDDIHVLREKLLESELVIFATPVYLFSCSGYMKILMERLLFPLTTPEYVLIGDRVYHPIRYTGRKWKSLLIANGAFDGDDVFKPLVDMYERAIHNTVNSTGESAFLSLGSITVGFGELFSDEELTLKCKSFFKNLEVAGQEIIQQGFLPDRTLAAVNSPIYHYSGITRHQAIHRINEIIAKAKSKYNSPTSHYSI